MDNILLIIFITSIITMLVVYNFTKKHLYNRHVYILKFRMITLKNGEYIDDFYLNHVYFSDDVFAKEWATDIISQKEKVDEILNMGYIQSNKPSDISYLLFYGLTKNCKKNINTYIAKECLLTYTIEHVVMKR